MKKNCWEFKNCGREHGGRKAKELGVCTAATERLLDGVNSGKNGGRACWPLAGTLCSGTVQGSFATKLLDCMKCDFYRLVSKEEGESHQNSKEILKRITS